MSIKDVINVMLQSLTALVFEWFSGGSQGDFFLQNSKRNQRAMAAMHTGVVQNKSIACQADWFLLDGNKEQILCPVFLLQSNLLL
jgi:hypothetical protein